MDLVNIYPRGVRESMYFLSELLVRNKHGKDLKKLGLNALLMFMVKDTFILNLRIFVVNEVFFCEYALFGRHF